MQPIPISIYYINIRGFKSKSISLEAILVSLNPDVVVLCEIKTVSAPVIRKFFEDLGYDAILKKASGIVIAAKFKLLMVNVTKSVHNNVLAGSIRTGSYQSTIIALYGPQETEGVASRTEFYEEVCIEVQACVDKDSQPILIGDFNAKISDYDGISSMSPNGSLLKDVVDQFK